MTGAPLAVAAPAGGRAEEAPILAVNEVTVRFGGIVALDSVSFTVRQGEICGIIGPNGAGKTTLFNCLSRIYRPVSGSISFRGHRVEDYPQHRLAALGIGRTFQNLALFRSMSVLQNVLIGGHSRTASGYLANLLRLPSVGLEEAALLDRARELIAMVGLETFANSRVSDLPFGIQKRVELARALASRPTLLMLDEPAAGLNHEELDSLRRLILDLRERLSLTLLLVEHHMSLVMSVSNHVVALDFGRKIADGTPSEVQNDPDVIRAYLGTG